MEQGLLHLSGPHEITIGVWLGLVFLFSILSICELCLSISFFFYHDCVVFYCFIAFVHVLVPSYLLAVLDIKNPRYEIHLCATCTVHGAEIDSL